MTVTACPECDSAQIYERSTVEPPWRCPDCDGEFDSVVERESKSTAPDSAASTSASSEIPIDPDTTAGFADIEPGDKVLLSKADTDGYYSPHAVLELEIETVWDVPFGDDWIDAEGIVSMAPAKSTKGYRIDITPGVGVSLYRPLNGEPIEDAKKHIADIESVERAGQVSRSTYLQYFVDDGRDTPDGDDSYRAFYRGGRSA